MRKFMKLVDIEINRVFKIFLPTLLVYMVLGIGNSIIMANNTMTAIKDKAKIAGIPLEKYLKSPQYGRCSIKSILDGNMIIKFGIVIIIVAVIIYSLIIWYREWFGNNKTIYTLLMIPLNRGKMYIAKFLTIAIMLLSSISAFILTLTGFYMINKKMIPKDAIETYFLKDIIGNSGQFSKVFSNKMLFLIAVLAVISLIFLFCILERSFRLKGLILGLILVGIVLASTIFIITQKNLYYIEKKWLIMCIYSISIIGSIIYCNYLLKNKVAV